MNMVAGVHRVNTLDPRGAVLEDISVKTSFYVETPLGGDEETLFVVMSTPFLDDDDDNTVVIEVVDSSGERHVYATYQLGLTSDRYGAWHNIAHVISG